MRLTYWVSGRRLFYALKRLVLETTSEVSGECQRVISGEGVSPSLSPRRLRAKYTLRTKLRFVLRGFRPCRGQIRAGANQGSTPAVLPISMRPKERGAWKALLLVASFLRKCEAAPAGLRRSPLCLSGSDSRESPGYGHRFTVSRPMAAAHKEIDGIGLSAKGKGKGICEKKLIYRNGETA